MPRRVTKEIGENKSSNKKNADKDNNNYKITSHSSNTNKNKT